MRFSKKHAKWQFSGNDGLTKYFYKTFSNELKKIFV